MLDGSGALCQNSMHREETASVLLPVFGLTVHAAGKTENTHNREAKLWRCLVGNATHPFDSQAAFTANHSLLENCVNAAPT